jgi:sortase A
MILRALRSGKPFSSVPASANSPKAIKPSFMYMLSWKATVGGSALALSMLISLACFNPSFAEAPALQALPDTGAARRNTPAVTRVLKPGTSRPSARSIAHGASQPKMAIKKQTISVRVTKPGIPKRISIPSANIDANVISLGLLPGGKLDAPSKGKDTGWYKGSVKPGEVGTAVIDGHLDTAEGPGAFWDLKHVNVGDTVHVTDDQGVSRAFRVTKTAVYDVNKAPMEDIFTSESGTHVNLITCAGKWSLKLDHYEQRLIVYTELIPSEAVAIQ